MSRSEPAGGDGTPRWLFWAERPFADLQLATEEGRVETVTYRIPGHGSGWYVRVVGLPVVGLVRYEFGDWYGPAFPHGSRLVPARGAVWEPAETADRCVMLGSEDPGDPITTPEAEAIIVELGFPIAKLYEPRPDSPAGDVATSGSPSP